MTKTTQAPTLDELKARVLAGDQSVSADDLARATAASALTALRAEADRQLAEQLAAEAKHQRIRDAADKLIAVMDDNDTMDFADAMIREGIARRLAHYHRQTQVFGDTTGVLAREGIRRGGPEASGVEWRNPAMGLGERVIVDHRAMTPVIPHREIADAIDQGLSDAGVPRYFLEPQVVINPKPRPRGVPSEEERKLAEARRAEVLRWMAEQEGGKE